MVRRTTGPVLCRECGAVCCVLSPVSRLRAPRTNSRSPTERAESGGSNVRDGQMRSRSLTELELENTANGGSGGGRGGRRVSPAHQTQSPREDEGSSGDGGEETSTATRRKPRSVSNVDALYSGGAGAGIENGSPPRHAL